MFDNLSGMPVWLSDALCRLASGGSFADTDDEEVLFEAARPILLNGIEEVISRPDLCDRAIFLTLAPIGEAQRHPESQLWRKFEIARPHMLGALLDAAVHCLRTLGRVHLERLPRMADFALWAVACEPALWPTGTFARAYTSNRRAAIETIIEADPIATFGQCGPGARQTYCVCVPRLLETSSRVAPQGQKARWRSPGACGGRSVSYAPWASRSHSLEKAGAG